MTQNEVAFLLMQSGENRREVEIKRRYCRKAKKYRTAFKIPGKRTGTPQKSHTGRRRAGRAIRLRPIAKNPRR
ncbi:hypothetical protein BJD21_14420 [Dickeya solani D s0432-1]|nr:hypothetical protein A4U42_06615 [Dickeya solani IPO 2222]AUH09556.1 hypothetical protein BJD21_14420 [Dickeya solani D s0432-1]